MNMSISLEVHISNKEDWNSKKCFAKFCKDYAKKRMANIRLQPKRVEST